MNQTGHIQTQYDFFQMGGMRSKFSCTSSEASFVRQKISENCVVVFAKTGCPYCEKAKNAFDELKVPYESVILDTKDNGDEIQEALGCLTGSNTVSE